MAVTTVTKTIGSTGTFSTLQLWEDGAPADQTTAERTPAGTFSGTFVQGESLSFSGGATGTFLDSDGSTYITYGITSGNPGNTDTVTGASASCVLTGAPDFVGVVWRGECQNQEFTGANTLLTFSGVTTDTSAVVILTTVSGASFQDNTTRRRSALRYDSSKGAAIRGTSGNLRTVIITTNNVTVSKLQIKNEATQSTQTSAIGLQSGGTNAVVNDCILEGSANSSSTAAGAVCNMNNSSNSMRNCVLIRRGSGSVNHLMGCGSSGGAYYNCTLISPDDLTTPVGVISTTGAGVATFENCALFAGDSTAAVVTGGGTGTFTTCYSDISGTTGVTQTTYSEAFEDINNTATDARLKEGSALIGTGTTNATEAPADILAIARPAWKGGYDVGAHEYSPEDIRTLRVVASTRRW